MHGVYKVRERLLQLKTGANHKSYSYILKAWKEREMLNPRPGKYSINPDICQVVIPKRGSGWNPGSQPVFLRFYTYLFSHVISNRIMLDHVM